MPNGSAATAGTPHEAGGAFVSEVQGEGDDEVSSRSMQLPMLSIVVMDRSAALKGAGNSAARWSVRQGNCCLAEQLGLNRVRDPVA